MRFLRGVASILASGLASALASVLAGTILLAPAGLAQSPPAVRLLAGTYDPAIPTIESVVGHAPGSEISTPEETLRWFAALAAAAPDRVVVTPYATSWEGRELITAAISSPENIARIGEIKANMAKLASGTLSVDERRRLISSTPAVVWLAYGVHGDEISSTDAAIALSYDLVASKSDPEVAKILQNTVVVIDPMQNPDGRNRFVNSFVAARGLKSIGDPHSAEHDQPWPGGRYNHYLFDMNRDWFALTQPETIGRVRTFLSWRPTASVDAHEMNGDESYFFPPVAQPINPNVTKQQLELQTLVGRNNAQAFDDDGFDYFNRDTYDLFYPGYGDNWPTLNGAISFTYEQGGPTGLVYDRRDGTTLTYYDAVLRHFVSTFTTTQTVSDNKIRFLTSYADYRAQAIADGRKAKDRFFVIDLNVHRWQAEDLARTLAQQDITVTQADPGARLCGQTYPKGALVIDGAQPNHALLETLLSPTTPLDETFMAEQEKRRAEGLPHQLYDVTAWSLPLMDGLSLATCASVATGATGHTVGADTPISAPPNDGDASFGFAVPWTDAGQARLVFAALEAGLSGRSLDLPFTANGRTFARGTVVFAASHNPPDMRTRLRELARQTGAELVPMSTSWVEDGSNFGSDEAHTLMAPRIAMAWDEGVDPTSAGATRFILERRFGAPVAPIRTGSLAGADLSRYDVLILPEGHYADTLGDSGAAAINDFVENGGVLVGLGSAVRWLADPSTGLSALRRERAFLDPALKGEDKKDDKGATVPGTRLASAADLEAAETNRAASPDVMPGALGWTVADPYSWLSAGYDRAVVPVGGRDIYAPLNAADGVTALHFAAADKLLASGYLWKENRLQLALKPYATLEPKGKGLIIAFTQSPTTRAYVRGLDLLVANAVLLGPAHTE